MLFYFKTALNPFPQCLGIQHNKEIKTQLHICAKNEWATSDAETTGFPHPHTKE
jgi:hypothetical protein